MLDRSADTDDIVIPALLGAGLVFGVVIGRWWAVLGAVVVGVVIGLISEVEVSSAVMGVGSGLVAAFAIAVGVALRRGLGASARGNL